MMIETKRLIMRQWKEQDIPAMVTMNADHRVMKYFPKTYTEKETKDFIATCAQLIDEQGWGFWAIELKSTSDCIGLVGLNKVPDDLPVDESIEIGWRLAAPFWSMGYAREAANASLNFAFSALQQQHIVAFTAIQNSPSRKLMERIGMQPEPTTFMHPRVPLNSALKEHVLYKITQQQFSKEISHGKSV